MASGKVALILIVGLAPACTWAAAPITAPAVETSGMAVDTGYLPQWKPQPPASSAPAWARPGLISFARWDGGPIETAKAMLSGWPGFNPPVPDYLYVMTNWYEPATIGFLRRAASTRSG